MDHKTSKCGVSDSFLVIVIFEIIVVFCVNFIVLQINDNLHETCSWFDGGPWRFKHFIR